MRTSTSHILSHVCISTIADLINRSRFPFRNSSSLFVPFLFEEDVVTTGVDGCGYIAHTGNLPLKVYYCRPTAICKSFHHIFAAEEWAMAMAMAMSYGLWAVLAMNWRRQQQQYLIIYILVHDISGTSGISVGERVNLLQSSSVTCTVLAHYY